MKRQWLKIIAFVLVLGMCSGRACQAEPKEGAPVDTTARQAAPTTAPDLSHKNVQAHFDPQLEKYGYLRNIGVMIDQARERHDAQSLAMAALLLFQAEKASGKKSPDVTALAVLEEATKWAEQQKNAAAMTLVAQIWSDTPFGPGDSAKGKALSDKAKLFSAERQSAQRGSCRLLIRNLTNHTANIYADGQYLGTIDAYDTRYIYVENGYTELYAKATCHTLEWGPSNYRLGTDFTWRITP